jgi:hypothetical protein
MPDDFRHPAPPNYRSAKPGRGVARHRIGGLDGGTHRPNMSVVPKVHTNGIGERVFFEDSGWYQAASKIT